MAVVCMRKVLEATRLRTFYPVRARSHSGSKVVTPQASHEDLRAKAGPSATIPGQKGSNLLAEPQNPTQPHAHRLFGEYMNSAVTYHDASTAWLSSDSMLSWVTSSVYERFSGGGYMSGVKLARGYSEPSKSKEKDESDLATPGQNVPGLDERQQKLLKRRSAPPATRGPSDEPNANDQTPSAEGETRQARLQRQLSSLIERDSGNVSEANEEIRKREEQEIQDDYNAQAGEKQSRDIEHLVLVTHGIGQLLSLRYASLLSSYVCPFSDRLSQHG